MGALWIRDIRGLFTKRRFFGLIAGLVAAAAVFFLVRGRDGQLDASERVSIGIVNRDTSIYSKMLLSFYEENGLFTSYVSVYIGGEEEILSWFDEGKLDMYLIIPEDFADSMTYLEHLPVQAVISTRRPAIEILLKNLLQSYEKYISSVEIHCVALYQVMLLSGMPREQAKEMNDRISVQLILKALAKSDFFERYILENYGAVKLVPFYLHEVLLLLLTFFSLLVGVRFQKEHHAGIYARLAVLGVGSFSVIWQKALFFGTGLALLMAAAALLLNLAGVSCAWQVFLLFFLYAWLMSAVMLFVAAVFEKMKNYLLASNMILLLGAILGGGMIPFMYLPAGMRTAARFLPNYVFLRLIFDAEAGRLGAEELGVAVLCCAAGIALLLFGAGCLYRLKEGQVYENA